jgi:hypothetical protein
VANDFTSGKLSLVQTDNNTHGSGHYEYELYNYNAMIANIVSQDTISTNSFFIY